MTGLKASADLTSLNLIRRIRNILLSVCSSVPFGVKLMLINQKRRVGYLYMALVYIIYI